MDNRLRLLGQRLLCAGAGAYATSATQLLYCCELH